MSWGETLFLKKIFTDNITTVASDIPLKTLISVPEMLSSVFTVAGEFKSVYNGTIRIFAETKVGYSADIKCENSQGDVVGSGYGISFIDINIEKGQNYLVSIKNNSNSAVRDGLLSVKICGNTIYGKPIE